MNAELRPSTRPLPFACAPEGQHGTAPGCFPDTDPGGPGLPEQDLPAVPFQVVSDASSGGRTSTVLLRVRCPGTGGHATVPLSPDTMQELLALAQGMPPTAPGPDGTPEATPAEVRSWARRQGLTVADRGQLPRRVVAAYLADQQTARAGQISPMLCAVGRRSGS
ncbi:Lsr2 family DNA-binding protein [Cellulomonas denverensis]|uniref:Lsr2 DNA-binding domain-containing protein n=1 Tax=Cellulomonas denverensis TaxID=264297 RepID=A0A7X6KSQ8_9CELL|nr:Lsr2 family protein [Cellulomonas denverensis]NKY21274.1 hypothetical protein [Cellulomonas denverensis]GIG24567.1 hypothetical protein Cde04nite_08110 [Cellulomonas denverensis]